MTIKNCAFNNNTGNYMCGGAIHNQGNLTITNSDFNKNRVDDDAGAIYNSGNLTLKSSTFKNNLATESGG